MLTLGGCKHGPDKARTCGVCRLRRAKARLTPGEAQPDAATLPACAHRGAAVPKPDGRDWRACDHPWTPLGTVTCPCKGCGPSCGGYEPDGGPVSYFLPGVEDPLNIGPYRLGSERWACDPLVRDRHKAALLDLARRPFAYPGGSGRGVLIAGGGRHWHMSLILCRMLREVGCALPIQFWYRGGCEAVDLPKLEALGVACVDADAVADRHGDQRLPRGRVNPGGWEAKCYALAHTSLDEVLWLDSDIVPHADPAPLLDELAAAPLAYWDEGPTARNVRWPQLGFDRPPPGLPRAFQSGQFVIDRRRAWPLLAVGQWMAQHSDFFYRHMHGDQDAYLVAMGLLGVEPKYLGESRFAPGYGGVYYHRGAPLIEHYFLAKLTHEWAIPPAGRAGALRHYAAVLGGG